MQYKPHNLIASIVMRLCVDFCCHALLAIGSAKTRSIFPSDLHIAVIDIV